MGDGISIFNTEGDYKAKLAYRIKDGRGEKVKTEIQYLRWESKPVFKMEWGPIIYCVPTAFQDEKYQGCNYLISNGANILVDIKDIDDI